MNSSDAKNSILKKIRSALEKPTPIPFPQAEGGPVPVQPLQQDLVVEFAEQFTALGGKFIYCANNIELAVALDKLYAQQEWTKLFVQDKTLTHLVPHGLHTDDIVTCDAALTTCEALVARTGSFILSSKNSGRVTSVYAPIHICIAHSVQLVYDIKDALQLVKEKYNGALPSTLSLATGPSRTADIEKTLVVGVHGPKEVYCLLVDTP